jgi:uroporphyrinogen decarboxylase
MAPVSAPHRQKAPMTNRKPRTTGRPLDSKELVHRALNFELVPRVPYSITFTAAAEEKLRNSASGRDLLARISNDLILSPVIQAGWGTRDSSGLYTDEFGLVWNRRVDRDMGIPIPFVTPENLDKIRWPEPLATERFHVLSQNIQNNKKRFHAMVLDFSLYERAWGMRGLENFYLDLAIRPEFVDALLNRILDFNVAIIEAGLKAFPDIDAVHFGDDFGSQAGVPIGANRWRSLVKPKLAEQYAVVRALGRKVFIHSCGKVQEILDDLVEIGVDCFNPFQPEVMDVGDTFRRYYGRLAFWGGISIQRLLPFGAPEDVQREVVQLLTMGKEGGYIAAPSHAVTPDAKQENIEMLVRMLARQ